MGGQSDIKKLFHARGIRLNEIAERLGVDKSAVTRWTKGSFPPGRAIEVEAATAGEISRSDLRPDLWPRRVSDGEAA